MPRVATIATMPSRRRTFAQVLPVIAAQVDRVYVYLDGFEAVPAFLAEDPQVTVIRSQDVGRFRAAGRFLCLLDLTDPAIIISADDDIHYPRDYVAKMVGALEAVDGNAVVGVHGTLFQPPYRNYVRDGRLLRFSDALAQLTPVDQLGSGTIAFRSDRLSFDVRGWEAVRCDDIMVAREAKRSGLPLMCVPRPRSWLRAFRVRQAISLWREIERDPTAETALMRDLIAERVTAYDAAR